MSGFEIAGIVLASLPLIISALEHYRDVEQAVEGWRKIAFEQNLEELLLPLIVDDQSLERLLGDPGGPEWKEPELDRILQERLPKAYESYFETIEAMLEIMQELNKSLGMDKHNFLARLTGDEQRKESPPSTRTAVGQMASSFEFHTQRIKLALNRTTRQKLFDDFLKQNSNLRSILSSSDRLTKLRKSRHKAKSLTGLCKFWQHGNHLFQLLAQAWSCHCRALHRVNLLLQNRTAATVEFRVAFLSTHTVDSTSSIERHPAWKWQETSIKLLENIEADEGHLVKLGTDDSQTTLLPDISNNTSTSNTLVTFFTATSMSKSRQRYKTSLKGEPRHLPNSFVNKNFEGGNLTSDKHGVGIQASNLSLSNNKIPKTRVTFINEDRSPVVQDTGAQVITNLCGNIATCSSDLPDYGCLKGEVCRYVVRPLSEPQSSVQNHISLESLLSRDLPLSLNRRERYHIAAVIASSHVQLYPTPWLKSRWSKRDILFRYDTGAPGNLSIDQPYISQSDYETIREPQPSTSSGFAFQESLRHLGILLLELCFGSTIETHELWKALQPKDEQTIQVVNYAVATAWSREVVDEAGLEFSDAITWCLHHIPVVGNLGSNGLENDDKWRQDMFANVVEPISHCLDQLNPGKSKPEEN